jgi:phosphonate transport system substrate-binding protein
MLTFASFLAENARPFYERLAAYMGRRLGEPTELVAGLPLEERHQRLDDGRIQLAFICGLPYAEKFDRVDRPVELLCAPVMAHPRYGGRPVYFTDVIVRADSPLKTFGDLRGRSYAYNDARSNSGYVVPRHHLLSLGETAGYFGRIVASGAHQTSIRLVREGAVDASGIDSTVLELEMAREPALVTDLRVIDTIGPFPIPPVVASSRVPEPQQARLRAVLLGMDGEPEGRAVLAEGLVARFVAVADRDYDPIRAMVRQARAAGFLELR